MRQPVLPGSKTPGGAGTHTGHTRDTHGTHGRTRAHGSHRRTSQPSIQTHNTQPARPRDDRNLGRLNSRSPGADRSPRPVPVCGSGSQEGKVFTGTELDRSRPRLTLPSTRLTAVPIVNLHMYSFSQSVSFVAVPPRSPHHRLKGRLRSPRSTQVL